MILKGLMDCLPLGSRVRYAISCGGGRVEPRRSGRNVVCFMPNGLNMLVLMYSSSVVPVTFSI